MSDEDVPELFDRNGEPIVVMRRATGELFSNHPDYPMALALHKQSEQIAQRNREIEKAAAEEAAASSVDEVEDDVQVEPDNGDGKVEYTEMNSKDLVAEAKARGLTLPSGVKRTQVIAALEADDES